ncbi:MAG: hypothetical protein SCH71_14645 [Desulfobulbaceae bacterium]|nr:hypothetical protein [Desulfobulbaceae bacterium]
MLLFWDPASDSNRQIKLENEIWLTSTLVEYGLAVQIISLLIFVLAADHFSYSITGAMCATGSLLANNFGIPTLLVKIGGVFLYGFWIVLHQLDIQSEQYPLVRMKYYSLLLLLPLLGIDIGLVIAYLGGLDPDIITSCCGVVFDEPTGARTNLLTGFSHEISLGLFYGTTLVLFLAGIFLAVRWRPWITLFFSICWLCYFLIALLVVTTEFTPYIYAMPFHKCPFCVLKPEYHYIGLFIYTALFTGTFFGMNVFAVYPLQHMAGLGEVVPRFQKAAVRVSLILLFVFAALVSFYYLRYIIIGGEG